MNKPNNRRPYRGHPKRKNISREEKVVKKCKYCGHEMKARGASDASGGCSWKCRSKKCGRTTWQRVNVRPPQPIVPTYCKV